MGKKKDDWCTKCSGKGQVDNKYLVNRYSKETGKYEKEWVTDTTTCPRCHGKRKI